MGWNINDSTTSLLPYYISPYSRQMNAIYQYAENSEYVDSAHTEV